MQLRAEQLDGHLAKALAPLYAVLGDEPLLALEAADAIRAARAQRGYAEREVLDRRAAASTGASSRRRARACRSSPRKRSSSCASPPASPAPRAARRSRATASGLPADTADARLAAARSTGAAQKLGLVRGARARRRGGRGRAGRRATRCRTGSPAARARRSRRAPPETLEFLADRVEGNLLAAYQEVQKLALLLPAGRARRSSGARSGARRRALRRDSAGRGDARRRPRALSCACSTACAAKARRRRSCCGRSPRSCAR